jgi:hypothetical protein
MSPLTERCLEKYGKKLIGRANMDDALNRLDKLTQEARMSTAEVLRPTNAIDDRARGVGEQVIAVDDRVASVNDSVVEAVEVINGA